MHDFIYFFRNQMNVDLEYFLTKYNTIFKIYNYGTNNDKKIFTKPKIYENFITDKESEYILKKAENNYHVSGIGFGASQLDPDIDFNIRTSYVAWLPKNDKIIKKIILKVCKLTNMNFKNVEDLQVVKYEKGGFYKTHYDDSISQKNKNRTYRVFTFLMYLNDDYEGGQTKFPKINFTVQPKKNSAVFFHNLDDSKLYFNEYSLHGGLPVKKGTKYVANIWIHDSEWINKSSEKCDSES